MKVQYKKVFFLVTGMTLIVGSTLVYFGNKPQQDVKNILDSQEKLTSIFEDQSVSSTEKMLQDVILYHNKYLGISFVYPR